MSFEIKLPLFQGPFDLLLFFIERDELDIYDIPITRITSDFLEYLHHLERMNMELAGEFIWVAATLMRIKAKMLLPRPETDKAGNEIDPRQELVQHLLEYKKFKIVAAELSNLETDGLARYERGNLNAELSDLAKRTGEDFDLQSLDLYRLLKIYAKAMRRFEEEQARPRHTVQQYPYTMEVQKEWILLKIGFGKSLSFTEVLSFCPDKIALVFNFLAILELAAAQQLQIIVDEGFNNFLLKAPTAEQVLQEV
ncbi:MAG: segregation/condensation protein A [Bacteroidota bacterium]